MKVTNKNLTKLTTEENAGVILSMIAGDTHPSTVSPAAEAWYRSCFHTPSWNDMVMEAANELLGFYGVEGYSPNGENADCYGRDIISYCNTRDIYDLTLCLEQGRFFLASLGDIWEKGA